jgi:multisubunit Na+/H+ antiporter MnhE subunit
MITIWFLAVPFALVFMTLSNQLSWAGFAVGYVLSAVVLWLGQAYNLNFKPSRVLTQVLYLLLYSVRLAIDIFLSSVQVARMVLSPNIDAQIKPGVVKIETQDATNNEIVTAMSSHGITITPGQMVIDIEPEDGKTMLYIHNLNMDDSDNIKDEQIERLSMIRKILGYG